MPALVALPVTTAASPYGTRFDRSAMLSTAGARGVVNERRAPRAVPAAFVATTR